ncbi:MAG: Hsp20/alpha crystallin family protein [Spirochaetales bacterium]|nr:Hsp20/alpha crystallin family protein [Spirochaetales bacterium]
MNLINYKPRTKALGAWDFDSIFDNFFTDELFSPGVKSPKVDVREEEKAYIIEAELPGLSEKDVDVTVENDVLTISSVKTDEKQETKKDYLIRERRSQSFSRSFALPQDVDRDKIEAKFKNGLLVLSLHKNPKALPKQIEVKSN